MSYDLTDSLVDSYSVSKRLSFDLNSTQSPLKRTRNDDFVCETKRGRRDDMTATRELADESFTSTSTVVGMSPWESRRLKVDLIEARSRISHMKRELEQHHQARAHTESMLQDKVTQLTKQVDYTTKKAGDLEKHIQVLRKREADAKDDLLRAASSLKKARHQHEDQAAELRRKNQELEETLQCITNDLRNENSHLSRDLQSALQSLSTTQDELKAVQGVNSSLQERLTRMSDVTQELEEERQMHQAVSLLRLYLIGILIN